MAFTPIFWALSINALACLVLFGVQQFELARGRIPTRHSLIPASGQKFNHWQDAHCQTWGDLLGLGFVLAGFTQLLLEGKIQPLEWLAFGVLAKVGAYLWYRIGTDPTYKPNWCFPQTGRVSWGGIIHLGYFGACLAISILCLYHIFTRTLTGWAMLTVLAGWIIYGLAMVVDIRLGHKNPLLQGQQEQAPPLLALIKTGRIRGTVFTFFFTLSGFLLYGAENVDWLVAIMAGLSCSFLHMSIMTFNDWVDRSHDLNKGKRLAYDYPKSFRSYWLMLTLITLLSILALGYINAITATFCLAVLALGLAYSLVERVIVLNNLIVAICGASPVLVGSVYYGRGDQTLATWYAAFFLLIIAREILKDIEDAPIDPGYKDTLATKLGVRQAKKLSFIIDTVAGGLIVLTKKAYETLALWAFMLYRFVKWDPTSNPNRLILLHDTLIGLLVICMIVPQKYGTRELAMFDLWSIEHLLFGVMLSAMVMWRKPQWSIGKIMATVLTIAYSWELLEFTMEMGWFGTAISNWKLGFEHWTNRLIGDPGLAAVGALIQTKKKTTWKWWLIPWLCWGAVNYASPDSMFVQRFILSLLPW